MAAAAVPANQLVAFYLVRAQPQPADQPANQLYFDVALANNAPTATRYVPATTFRNDPPAVGNAGTLPAAFCNDRPNHDQVGTNGNPCTSTINPGLPVPPPPATANWAGAPFPGTYWHRVRCERLGAYGAAAFRICRYCRDHTARQPFFTDIKFDVLTPPGLPIASGGPVTQQELQDVAATATAPAVSAWRRFLTFLCQSCQFEEQALLQARRTQITNLLLIPGNLPNWQFFRPSPKGFPESTCTCLAWLEGPLNMVYCIDCRQHRACTRHDSRLMVRQQNDAWLRRTDRGPNGLKFAHKNKINGRRNRGVFRACRCGAEVLFNGHWSPQVFLCMGCEGVVHLAHYAGTNVAPPILARRTIVNTRSKARASDVLARTSKEFKLRREI